MDALVITPFSPIRPDAGHRKRTRETIENLYKIKVANLDLIYIPFEGADAFSLQPQKYFAEIPGVRDVFTIPFTTSIGSRPQQGQYHHLDEWFDDHLNEFISRLSRRRRYDLVVVHNVWLSKALSMFDHTVLKCVETHDVFSLRCAEFARIGVAPDFFSPQEKDELYGLNRADVLIAIAAPEAEYLSGRFPGKTVIYQPPGIGEAKHISPLPGGKAITIGMMGSAHPFNVDGARKFIAELAKRNRTSVKLVLAGELSSRLPTSAELPFVKRLGYVKDPQEFYDQVNVVVMAQFNGSGFPLKLSEALAHGKPVLGTRFVAEAIGDRNYFSAESARDLVAEVEWLASRRGAAYKALSEKAVSIVNDLHRLNNSADEQWANVLSSRRRTILTDARDLDNQSFALFLKLANQLALSSVTGYNMAAVISEKQKDAISKIIPFLARKFYLFVLPENNTSLPLELQRYLQSVEQLYLLPSTNHSLEHYLPGVKVIWDNLEVLPDSYKNFPDVVKTMMRSGTMEANARSFYFLSALVKEHVSWDPVIGMVNREMKLRPASSLLVLHDDSDFSRACIEYTEQCLPEKQMSKITLVHVNDAHHIAARIKLQEGPEFKVFDVATVNNSRMFFEMSSSGVLGKHLVKLKTLTDLRVLVRSLVTSA